MSDSSKQEQSKGGFLQRVLNRQTNKTNLPALEPTNKIKEDVSRSSFEDELFKNGALKFDPEKFMSKAKGNLDIYQQWLTETRGNSDETKELYSEDVDSKIYELSWQKHFEGRVPQDWEDWVNANKAFDEADKRKIQLSDTLVDAGVSYPHHLVANTTGKTQKLSIRQMAVVLARPHMPRWNQNEIIQAQKMKGVTAVEIAEAELLARDIRATRSHGGPEEGLKRLSN